MERETVRRAVQTRGEIEGVREVVRLDGQG